LETVGGADGRKASAQLRRLLPLKTRAEYDPAPVSDSESRRAVQAAQRMFTVVEQVVASALSR
jgi:hypothetical protein